MPVFAQPVTPTDQPIVPKSQSGGTEESIEKLNLPYKPASDDSAVGADDDSATGAEDSRSSQNDSAASDSSTSDSGDAASTDDGADEASAQAESQVDWTKIPYLPMKTLPIAAGDDPSY